MSFTHKHTQIIVLEGYTIEKLRTILLFASGEEKGKEGRIYTVYLLWILNHREGLSVFKMNKLNLKTEDQSRRSHFQYIYFKHSLNVKERVPLLPSLT